MPANQDTTAASTPAQPEQTAFRGRLREIATAFLRLGFTAFGGPAAHIALMEDEFVTRRRWLGRKHFLDLVAAVNFIPGPNSTELAIHIGQLRAGIAGLIVAGSCFIVPAVLIILPLAWMYVRFGTLPQVEPVLSAIGAAIVAVVAVATARFLRVALIDRFTTMLCIAIAIFAMFVQRHATFQPEIISLVIAAICGAVWYRRRTDSSIILPSLSAELWIMALFFLKVGATLFGSGYVLVSYLQSGLVDDYGWLTQRQMLDAIAVGQFTPGPLLTTATFIGFLIGYERFGIGGASGGLVGAGVATIAIFLPSFVIVAILGPLLQRLRRNTLARGALDAMNAAVVGLMLIICVRLARWSVLSASGAAFDWLNVVVMVTAAGLLLRKWNSTLIIAGAAAVGGIRAWAS